MLMELFKEIAKAKVGDIVDANLHHQSKDWDMKVHTSL